MLTMAAAWGARPQRRLSNAMPAAWVEIVEALAQRRRTPSIASVARVRWSRASRGEALLVGEEDE